jgi:drug/metabolite transporter (DMT)-like permease
VRRRSDSTVGVALVVGAAAAWSTAGYFSRLIPVGLFTMVVWRNVFGGAFMTLYVLATRRARTLASFARLGRIGWFAAVVNGASMICYLAALRHTSVANVVVIYATAPFVAAAIARLAFGDPASRQTLLAGLVALVGVAVTVGGTPDGRGVTGDVLALLMTVGLASFTVLLRHHRGAEMLPAAAASGWIGALLALPFVSTLDVGTHQLVNLALFGVTSFGLGLVLYTLGARHLHPARTALISALDTPLAPLWVWLAFDERPSTATILGGLLVLAAVIGNIVGERQPTRGSDSPHTPAAAARSRSSPSASSPS